MNTPKTRNRWLIALSAIAIHLSIGSAYAYSVFKNPLLDLLGWDNRQTSASFTIAIFILGFSAAAFGRWVEKWGPRKSAAIAALLFSFGQIGAGLAVQGGSLIGFYLAYGLIGGMGLGIGYISPVSTLVKWFPDRRGLATGMAVMGFGAGSLICSPVAAALIESVGIAPTFYVLGTCYLALMLLGASYIAKPPENWAPPGFQAADSEADNEDNSEVNSIVDSKGDTKRRTPLPDLEQLTAKQAIKTRRFWLLWTMMFINISAGIMLISVASPMAQEKAGLTVAAAASMVGIMGLFNGGGRIGWASFSDLLGRPNVFVLFFSAQLLLFAILPVTSNAILFQIFIYIIISMYGGGFASLPAFIADLFGTKQLGAIHGLLLTSWSMAGIIGPMIVANVRDLTGGYDAAFYIIAGLLAIALIASLVIRAEVKKRSRQLRPDHKPVFSQQH